MNSEPKGQEKGGALEAGEWAEREQERLIKALEQFMFSFEEIHNKEGYQEAISRFVEAKRHARVVISQIQEEE